MTIKDLKELIEVKDLEKPVLVNKGLVDSLHHYSSFKEFKDDHDIDNLELDSEGHSFFIGKYHLAIWVK